jgi:hypothetical protein
VLFYAEMHQNNIFLFFKKLFLKSAHQNDPKHTKKYFFTKKTFKFFGNTGITAFPNTHI